MGDLLGKSREAPMIYQVFASSLGPCLVALTLRGISVVRMGESVEVLEARFKKDFPTARPAGNHRKVKCWARALRDYLNGRKPWPLIPHDVSGTAFQRRVWEYLVRIPSGETRSYSQVAVAIGRPRAVRAVARACAANPAGLIIPCHRVVPKSGGTGGYAWGPRRKKRLLEMEARRR